MSEISLELKNIKKSFQEGEDVLESICLTAKKGEFVTLLGSSGCGKTTTLRIIAGLEQPDSGQVFLDGKDVTSLEPNQRNVNTVFQNYALFPHMNVADNIGYGLKLKKTSKAEISRRVKEMLELVQLPGFERRKPSELSGGQRSKVLLTKLLLQNSQILLLDEPTNYLDVEHIEWLTKFLQNYEHAFILISHDIPFLNKVVNVIYHLENCELTRYSGDYDKFQEMYAIYQSQKAAAYERQQQEVAKLEDFIARNKARVATTNMAKSRQRKLDKMEMIEKPREKLKPTFKFTEARTPSRFIVEANDLVLGYDSPLTRPVTFNLERGQKIAIRGVNGLGKTTLLKTILGIIPPVSGKVELGEFLEPGYFEQEEREKNENTALDDVWNEYPGLTNYEVRAALAGCGLTNEHITSKVFVLSGGEAAKVRLCKLMLKDVNWLVLDEPTNHLDVDAKDELKRALKEFKGSVLLVSHEPEFYEDWVDKVWNIEDWTTKII